jgi:inactivated superfamily I helicase
MGMLETRCLDFDNIIITSFNEGIFPKSDIGSSLIPYSIRKPYNIPTTDHQDAIFSYNFYRLIKRAKNVWCVYDTRNNNDNCTGEVSRFVKQLEYIYNVPINKSQIIHIPEIYEPNEIEINKSDEDILEIKNFLQNKGLSPSALNNYIECPLKF